MEDLIALIRPLGSDTANAIPERKTLLYSDGSKLKVNYSRAFGDTVDKNATRGLEELEGE